MVKSGQKPRFSPSALKDKPKFGGKPSFGRKPRDAAVVQKVPQEDDEESDPEQTGLFPHDPPEPDDPLMDEIARRRRELQELERAVAARSLNKDGPMVLPVPERMPSADSWEAVGEELIDELINPVDF